MLRCVDALKDINAPFRGAVFDERGIHQDRLPQCTREHRLAHVAEVQSEDGGPEGARGLEDKKCGTTICDTV